MQVKIVAACALASVLAVPVFAEAGSPRDRATGGGQVLVGSKGAGDTIAFTAQQDIDGVKGQVQFVDRGGDTQTTYHGQPACLDVAGNVAKIAGTWADGGNFQLYVEDNGEGAAAESDVVTMMNMADDPTCDFDSPDDSDKVALARGNAQVYDAPSGRRSRRGKTVKPTVTRTTLSFTKALSLAGLR